MTTFDDRERGFEAKFAKDSELQFRAEARRNHMLGIWAAGLLGKSGAEAEEYALSVVKSDFEEAGSDDVVRKVAGDLVGKVSEQEIRSKLVDFMQKAKQQLMSGT
ncbi:DUF1476 domain-containing protein [Tabrizicola sp. J26]|uniref:DUF1476 domain-containing protein n=1 Tax=Alitabrizicola rongguiensis TaxID=2909234 RepID=UPI001F2F60BE|nr:DUF1476 domain-containing protein [Tabrizicola rongguiensis]MCF1708367.1 DUF1476 domain-containing protein [Tabrizicola rongguiensis]